LNESAFSKEQLSGLITEKEKELEDCKYRIKILNLEKEKNNLEIHDFKKLKDTLSNWQDLFKNADSIIKKNLLKNIIRKVIVFRDRIEVHMRVDIPQITSLAKKSHLKLVSENSNFKALEKVISVAFKCL